MSNELDKIKLTKSVEIPNDDEWDSPSSPLGTTVEITKDEYFNIERLEAEELEIDKKLNLSNKLALVGAVGLGAGVIGYIMLKYYRNCHSEDAETANAKMRA